MVDPENLNVSITDVTLNKIRFGIADNLYPQDMKYQENWDESTKRLQRILTWNLLGKTIETRRYPATWWDAFKERWVPRSLKKHFTINYAEFPIYNICPHISADFKKASSVHLSWLNGESK